MKEALQALQGFNIEGAIDKIALFGSGHINKSYKVDIGGHSYFLQQLNTDIFTNSQSIESNLNKLFSLDSDLFVKHYRDSAGCIHHESPDGIWRLMDFADDTNSLDLAGNGEEAYQIALGFGRFLKHTNSLEADSFREPIPDFHDLSWRLQQLNSAIDEDKAGRREECSELIDKAYGFKWIEAKLEDWLSGGLPKRVCHNDTKANNCLLSTQDGRLKYIVDLDTIGPGYLFYDFGDLMRTLLSQTTESEKDESRIQIRHEIFRSLISGFLSEIGQAITSSERQSLVFGGVYMSYLMGVRFLTDYLNGDQYYQIGFENENYIRARNQLKIVSLIHDYRDELEFIIDRNLHP